jgi:all-trans-retinol 13,14-reductase
MSVDQPTTLIVGAGIAVLTAAAYLSRAGHHVVLCEKNKECGGLVSSFTRDGFHFEAGLRALEDAGIILPMLKDLGIELERVPSPVSVGVENEIITIESVESLEAYREMLKRLYPESGSEIDAILKVIRKIMKHMEVLYGIENPAFKDFMNDREYLFKKLLPWLPRFLLTVGKINRMNMPIEPYLDTILKNRSLKDIIAQHFFKNTPTFFALSYFSLYLDYFYPVDGVGKLAESVEDKIIEFGGTIRTETTITEVDVVACRAKDQNNVSYPYDNLIWASDLKSLYKVAVTDGLEPKIKARFDETGFKVNASRGSDSIFSLYLEVDEPLESFKSIATGHFFYTPSKQGLGKTHREELDDLLDNWAQTGKEEIYTWLDKFTRLNTYEISIPGLKNSALVPPGKTGMIISFLAEYDLFKKVRDDGWYDTFKSEMEDRIVKVISESIYPMLENKIMKRFSFTPLDIEKRINSSEGAIVGWTFDKPMPVVNKIQFSDRSVLTPVPTIFQAGQWAYSPAGVPMAILTGKLAADKVLKKKMG